MKLKGRILLVSSIIIAVAIMVVAIYNTESSHNAFENILQMELEDELSNLERAVESTSDIIDITKEALNAKNIDLTMAIAKMIDQDPTLLSTQKMVDLAKVLNVEEIHVIDGQGVLFAGNVEGFFGFDFNGTEQTKPFLELIGNKGASLAQEPAERGTDKKLFQYVGVSRIDEPGIVQIGVEPMAIQGIIDNFSIQKRIEDIVIGELGFALFIEADGTIIAKEDSGINGLVTSDVPWLTGYLSSDEEFDKVAIDGVDFYLAKQIAGDTTFVVTYPTESIDTLYIKSLVNNSIVIVISIAMLVVLISILINRIVIKPINLLQKAMEEVGNGDFSASINYNSKDEIGHLTNNFRLMVDKVSNLIHETKSSIEAVASSSEIITSNVDGLTSSSNEVTRAVEEIAGGTNVMAQNVNERLLASQLLGDSVNQIYDKLTDAEKVTKVMVGANQLGVERINTLSDLFKVTIDNTNNVALNVEELSENSKAIETIVGTIKGIANQTNLLALNASIEAARAGESGSGFAVVAEEIRTLAEQSATSAEEINAIIGRIVSTVVSTSETVEDTQNSVNSVKSTITETVEGFNKTGDSVAQVETIIGEFINETKVIEGLKNELIESLESMAAISQESAAATEEINASTEEQLSRVTEIGESIEVLNEDILRLADETKRFTV